MSLQSEIELHTRQLAKLAPKGYFFTLHIRYAMPVVSRQTFRRDGSTTTPNKPMRCAIR
jgi:LuxR family transcriptional regulator